MRYPTPGPNGGAPWRIRPTSVHDGDTLYAVVDRGDDDLSTWTIRLKDVFAPELRDAGGTACREFVSQWLGAHADGTDWPFTLETFRTPRSDVDDKSLGRMVGIVTSSTGASLNADVEAFITTSGFGGGVGAK